MAWPVTFVAGTAPTAADLNTLTKPPSCKAYDNTGLTVTNAGTYVLITLSGEAWDYTTAMHDTSTNTARIYARGTGKFQIHAQVVFPSTSFTGYRHLVVMKNNAGDTSLATGTQLASKMEPPNQTSAHMTQWSGIVSLTDGDYIEMYARQNSASSFTLTAGEAGAALTLMGVSG